MKILWRSDKDKITFNAIENIGTYGLRETVSKHLNSFRRIWNGGQSKTIALADGVVLHLHEKNYDSATINISVFTRQRMKHFISEWYLPKNCEIGSLVVGREKRSKTVTLTTELWAWTGLGSRRAVADIFIMLIARTSEKLQKFINFCLKVGHSAKEPAII